MLCFVIFAKLFSTAHIRVGFFVQVSWGLLSLPGPSNHLSNPGRFQPSGSKKIVRHHEWLHVSMETYDPSPKRISKLGFVRKQFCHHNSALWSPLSTETRQNCSYKPSAPLRTYQDPQISWYTYFSQTRLFRFFLSTYLGATDRITPYSVNILYMASSNSIL